jgi:hypothetical protein
MKRILHHHSHFTRCARNYFPHLPSNEQGQYCRPLPHVRLKTNASSRSTNYKLRRLLKFKTAK